MLWISLAVVRYLLDFSRCLLDFPRHLTPSSPDCPPLIGIERRLTLTVVVLLVLATEVLEVLVLEVLALVVSEVVVVTVMLTLRSPPVNQMTGTQAADLQPPIIIIILHQSSNARYKA